MGSWFEWAMIKFASVEPIIYDTNGEDGQQPSYFEDDEYP